MNLNYFKIKKVCKASEDRFAIIHKAFIIESNNNKNNFSEIICM